MVRPARVPVACNDLPCGSDEPACGMVACPGFMRRREQGRSTLPKGPIPAVPWRSCQHQHDRRQRATRRGSWPGPVCLRSRSSTDSAVACMPAVGGNTRAPGFQRNPAGRPSPVRGPGRGPLAALVGAGGRVGRRGLDELDRALRIRLRALRGEAAVVDLAGRLQRVQRQALADRPRCHGDGTSPRPRHSTVLCAEHRGMVPIEEER